jgi:hypothetical protein
LRFINLTFATVYKQYIGSSVFSLFQPFKTPENRLMNGRVVIAASYAFYIEPAISRLYRPFLSKTTQEATV